MFEGNYGNLTFAHVIASNCSWIFFIIIYLFGLVLWFFCFLCHSVSNSRQNVEVYMSYWVLLWKLQGYKGNCFQSTRKELLGNTHVTNSNQILLSFTFVSYSLDIMLKLKADFFYPQDKGNEIHSLLLLQQVWHDLFASIAREWTEVPGRWEFSQVRRRDLYMCSGWFCRHMMKSWIDWPS